MAQKQRISHGQQSAHPHDEEEQFLLPAADAGQDVKEDAGRDALAKGYRGGLLTAADIDRLSTAVRDGLTDSEFDLNDDGDVNVGDVVLLVDIILERTVPDQETLVTSDCNRDTAVDIGDEVTVELMEGRSTEVKAGVSDQCLAIVDDAFSRAGKGRNLQITIAVSDLERATYRKIPEGTIPDREILDSA